MWTVALKVVGIILIVDTLGVQGFDLPKSLFSRATAWLLAALIGWSVVRYGPAIVPGSRIHWAVLALVVVAVLSTTFAEDRYVALFGEWQRYLGLTFILDMAVLYVAVAIAYRTMRDWATLGIVVLAALALALGYALIQKLGLDPVPWADDPRPRPFATLGNADIFGQLLSTAFGAGLGVAIAARERFVRALAAGAAIAALLMATVIATRGSAIGIAAALLSALGLVLIGSRRTITIGRPLLILAAGSVVAAAVIVVSPLGERLRATLTGAELSQRLVIYRSALDALRARPLLGWGPDGMAAAYPHVSGPDSVGVLDVNSFLSSAHSWVLQTGATLGLSGLLALLVLIAATFGGLFRRSRADSPVAAALLLGSIAYWVHGLVTVGSISVDWLPWVAAGGAVALAGRGPAIVVHRWIPRGLGLARSAAVVLVLAGLVLEFRPLQANRAALQSVVASTANDGARAVAMARSALASDDGRATYWVLLAEGLERQQAWKAAGDAQQQAADRTPYAAATWEGLAVDRTHQAVAGDESSGGRQAALDAAARAAAVDPYNAGGFVVQAQVANALGDFDTGLRAGARAYRLAPHPDENYDRILSDAASGTTQLAEARATLEQLWPIRRSVILRLALVRVELKQGDLKAARADLDGVLQLDPANEQAKQLDGQIPR